MNKQSLTLRDKTFPNLDYEQALWKQGFHLVAGVDEVGRGAWAGPVVAAAVVFDNARVLSLDSPKAIPPGNNSGAPSLGPPVFVPPARIKIDDSKRLNATQRELAAEWVREHALSWGIGEVGACVINRLGIAKATKMAFRRAVAKCNSTLSLRSEATPRSHIQPLTSKIDYLLIDAFYIPYVNGVRHNHQLPIVKGDQKSFSIAAASIIAKVYRDTLMQKIAFRYPNYRWETNKGYGTKEHQLAILRNGLIPLHRVQFVETWTSKQGISMNI